MGMVAESIRLVQSGVLGFFVARAVRRPIGEGFIGGYDLVEG